jgi:GNAT superfamily N-acetyltransferase
MDKKDWDIWDSLTFKTISYNKNFDLINYNDSFINYYAGTISKIRLSENKPPFILGDFGITSWNIGLGKRFSVDFNGLLFHHKAELIYSELRRMIKEEIIDIETCERLVLITNLVVHPDYRKHGVTEEFIEYVYRQFYNEKTAIVVLVKPLQDNEIDKDVYFNKKFVEIRESLENYDDYKNMRAAKYYSLDTLLTKTDTEINEYKLFAVAAKCGFERIGDSYLFMFRPRLTFKRILEKREIKKTI